MVRLLRRAGGAEVVATFLRGEIDSIRFGAEMRDALRRDGHPASIVRQPNLGDRTEIVYRERLLGELRGWKRHQGMFEGFPARMNWRREALTPSEALGIRYINWSYWSQLSGKSRLATEAARRIRSGLAPEGASATARRSRGRRTASRHRRS